MAAWQIIVPIEATPAHRNRASRSNSEFANVASYETKPTTAFRFPIFPASSLPAAIWMKPKKGN